MITLQEVNTNNKNHVHILFKLLKGRSYSISHENTISLEEHIHFVKNNPYRKWFIVYNLNKEIGTCYCTYENYLGLNLIIDKVDFYKETIVKLTSSISPLEPKPSVRNKKFCINI